jgi:Septin
MRHLATLTNIIPIIAKSDSLSHTQTLTLKLSLLRDLKANQIPIFTFGRSLSELEHNVVNGMPYAISSLRDDIAEMDASLLMQDAQLDRYVESDLPTFVSMVVENAGWLRFATTKKFLEWRARTTVSPTSSEDLISFPSTEMSLVSIRAPPATNDGFAMATVNDHIDREERVARVRLVQWASEMRKSIRRKMTLEREEFERVEAAERVKWLVAKLNEAIAQQDAAESALVPVSSDVGVAGGKRRSSGGRRRGGQRGIERDPLGLVWVKERWGPRFSQGIVWIVEAGVVIGSGWVVWKYVVDSGLTGWFIQNAARNT